MNRFANRTALVTGGSTGIGRVIAHHLAEQGAHVVITGRNEDTLKEAASHNERISFVVADVGHSEDVERTLAETRKRHGGLDILVNNAGVAPVAPLAAVDMSQYDSTFLVLIYQVVATIYFDKEAISVPLPFCSRLRRRPLVAGGCTAECRRIVITSAATCLNGVP